MDKETVLNIVNEFKNNLTSKGVCIEHIVLFGSHTNNTQRPDSDIDLIVISDTFKGMDYWERINLLADAISDIFQPIEAVAMTKDEWDTKAFMAAKYAQNGIHV